MYPARAQRTVVGVFISYRSKIFSSWLIKLLAIDAHKLRLEYEDAIRRNWTHASGSVAPFGLNSELPLLAGTHIQQSLFPAFDHLSFADIKRERCAAIV